MFIKTITYTDFNGKERTEDHYFNLTRSEIMEMDARAEEGIVEKLRKISNEKDNNKVMDTFKDLIFKSYGIKSDDGRRFIKSPEISAEFEQTLAYDEFFSELAESTDAVIAFVNGIIPQEKSSNRTTVASLESL